jgi:RimJ/RimL family protein N-acetyltransferase
VLPGDDCAVAYLLARHLQTIPRITVGASIEAGLQGKRASPKTSSAGANSLMQVTIREAQPSDAEQLIAYVQRLAEEPDVDVPLAPGEFTLTVEEEERVLADRTASDNSIMLVAELGGRIIGQLGCRGGKRRAVRHAVALGMSVGKAWRNQGIGTALMARAIEWARGSGIVTRIEVKVYARNEMAIHLYEKFGFQIEGRRRGPICHDGEYVDDYIMGLLL